MNDKKVRISEITDWKMQVGFDLGGGGGMSE